MCFQYFRYVIFIYLAFFINIVYSQIAITEVFYDTPFDESSELYKDSRGKERYWFKNRTHHLGEFIELYNYTTEDISLEGWYIWDNAGRFDFPKDAVIKSEDFLIIAYRDLSNNPDIGGYFPVFFPNTKGLESKILYQENIILNNIRDQVSLYASTLVGIEINGGALITTVKWDNTKSKKISNDLRNNNYKTLDNRNFYDNSLQMIGNKSYVEKIATPLYSSYVPKTLKLLEIPTVQDVLRYYAASLDWSGQVNEILGQTSNLSIGIIRQLPNGIYNKEELCFVYDASGNFIKTEKCKSSKSMNVALLSKEEKDNEINKKDKDEELTLDVIKSYITVYPNPTPGPIKVNFDKKIYGQISKVEAFTMSRELIKSNTISKDDSETKIDLSFYPTGVYILKFTLKTSSSFSVNIIKQ